ncbi:MAG: bifunctional DNA-formamidopyrimidine glycosylase/DNA-(apurinic or apyrimidinic site) lyase [Candidatus Caldatribacteriota bacterium]|nr:bifunctional DNA-formamidopyrimidine glycosylase/DNA-(apurinic or apyrimidinic site) lyase [Candidatus Caldatribacteriota bacterium]
MPELPEVETIKRGLENKIKGKEIKNVKVSIPKLIKEPSLVEFVEKIKDRIIKKVTRRGKYIITYLDSKEKLVIHLGMTGLLIYPYNKDNEEIMSGKIKSKHNHIIFNFTDNSQLVFNDMRRFSKVYLVSDIDKIKGLSELGFEPLDNYFTEEAFIQILNKKKRGKIKPFLMNQKFITGLGNIYANEVLYRSGIHPLRFISSFNKEEIKKLYQQIRVVLSEAIKLRGSTVADEAYYDTDGRKGEFVKKLQVYGRKGKPCIKCGSIIEVIRINGRSSFICPHCQKL